MLTRRLTLWLCALGLPCALFVADLSLLGNDFWYHYIFGESFGVVTFIAIVAMARTGAVPAISNPLARRPMVYLGRRSYGICLYHNFILGTSGLPRLGKVGVVNFVVCSMVTIVLAILSWRYVEQPILKLKSRFPYRVRKERVASAETASTRPN